MANVLFLGPTKLELVNPNLDRLVEICECRMVFITEDMLRKRAEHNNCEITTLEELSLHQLDIEKIEHLDKWCRELKILYLQSNLIPRIENVGKLKKLEYLNLALNNITKVENLRGCESLNKLDLTVNFISELTSIETLLCNQHLKELYLTGNPCTEYEGYREYVVALLPQLRFLDGREIEKSERILAMQRYHVIHDDIIQQQKQYTLAKRKTQNENSDKLGETGLGDKWYTDSNLGCEHPTRSDSDETFVTQEEKDRRFWEEATEYTPESRIEMHRHLEEKRKEKEKDQTNRLDPNPPTRQIRYFTDDGRPLNINQAKMNFKLKETDNDSAYELEIPCYKHLDTSLIDVDVQPMYVRVNLKGKTLQLVLSDEVSPDNSSAKRSQTTGSLLIKMPKTRQFVNPSSKTQIAKKNIDKHMFKSQNTVSDNKTNKGGLLEVDQNARTMVDIGSIVKESKIKKMEGYNKESYEKQMENSSFCQHLADTNHRTNESDFVDDPEVPPLI